MKKSSPEIQIILSQKSAKRGKLMNEYLDSPSDIPTFILLALCYPILFNVMQSYMWYNLHETLLSSIL